tara:strand:+ start:2878 stop:3918 length:1041 start_codon:yes stop_codon:yes gene_type:complete
MSFSNYEQSVIINGYALSGVQEVAGSYGISEKPIKVAGVGFIDALINSPLEGSFSLSRSMVSSDPLLELNSQGKYKYDEEEFEGAILYENQTKGFGFTQGRVSKYSVSCSIGGIPEMQTDFTVYGNLGSGVSIQAPTKTHPPIKYPDQSSMRVIVSDFSIDAITDFSYSRSLNLQSLYAIPKGTPEDWNDIGSEDYASYVDSYPDLLVSYNSAKSNGDLRSKSQFGKDHYDAYGNSEGRTLEVVQVSSSNLNPIQIDTQYPIETDINFTMIADEYEIREIKDRIQSAPKSDVVIEIRDALNADDIINSFTGHNMRLISESVTSSTEQEMSISLTYKGYETLHNPVS